MRHFASGVVLSGSASGQIRQKEVTLEESGFIELIDCVEYSFLYASILNPTGADGGFHTASKLLLPETKSLKRLILSESTKSAPDSEKTHTVRFILGKVNKNRCQRRSQHQKRRWDMKNYP